MNRSRYFYIKKQNDIIETIGKTKKWSQEIGQNNRNHSQKRCVWTGDTQNQGYGFIQATESGTGKRLPDCFS